MTDPQPMSTPTRIPFVATDPPLTRSIVLKLRPGADLRHVDPLALVWDESIHRIIDEMMVLSSTDQSPLHINLREEMVFALANLQLGIAKAIVEKRLNDRDIAEIDVDQERNECLGVDGSRVITATAKVAYQAWSERMEERWKPKSLKQIARDANPRPPKLSPKPVNKNHFIPRWFIRDHWAVDGRVLRWRRENDIWTPKPKGFAEWGYRQKLYSDRLEAYFSLIDQDAKAPIDMLLKSRPLNGPQRQSLIGFLVVGMLRSPFMVEYLRTNLAPLIAELGLQDDATLPSRAYDTLYSNNDLYSQLARPLFSSQWARVRAKSPVFVLPDMFCVQGNLGDGMRLIVPLNPVSCFVTLPSREKTKSILPVRVAASDELARRISSALVNSAVSQFISHPDFRPQDATQPIVFSELLAEIEAAAR